MSSLLIALLLIPVFGFGFNIAIAPRNEKALSNTALITVTLHLLSIIGMSVYWASHHFKSIDAEILTIYQHKDYRFYIDVYFDKVTFVYLITGSFLTSLVTRYSRFYMHRESGFKRFFNTILFFYMGYTITILAGNFETLFIGWEILGMSSFLLIAFYRERYLPVKNANKVFSVYRIGDIGLILTMWASHYLWHENITFYKLHNSELVHEHLSGHSFFGIVISLAILVAASAKSAQLPFSSWLPRAMEGPTPSSAIFYGSLSVHLGAFLLLRTFNFWEFQYSIRVIIVLLGLITSILATLIARVQSSVKSQIAYSSVSQIGIIFIEIALGLESLALIHFAGNAFLRTYQLLVSPSVVNYLIKEQFFNFVPNTILPAKNLKSKLYNTFYILSMKEFNLDNLINFVIWQPIKVIGSKLSFMNFYVALVIMIPSLILGILSKYYSTLLPIDLHEYLPSLYGFIGFLLVLKSFTERRNPILSWLLLLFNSAWITIAISFNDEFSLNEIIVYLSGILVFGSLGIYVLRSLKKLERKTTLNQYNGHIFEHPKLGFLFLLSSLGIMGFPISPTFIGIDLMFNHIHQNQFFLAFFMASSFIVGGISLIRMYSRLFLGIHSKTYHEYPYKSA